MVVALSGNHHATTTKIIEQLTATGFELTNSPEREHYPAAEYPCKRANIWANNRAHSLKIKESK